MPKPTTKPPTGQSAMNDSGLLSEDGTILIDVLANDPKSSSIYLLNGLDPSVGPILLGGGASIQLIGTQLYYDPGLKYNYLAAGQTAQETFTYSINTKNGTVSTATVTLTIAGVNDAPTARADSYTVVMNANLGVITPQGLLHNDSDPENSPLTVSGFTAPTHGTVHVNADGSFAYSPETFYYGPDSFTYTVSDGVSQSAPQTVSIYVWGPSGTFTLNPHQGIDLDTGNITSFATNTDAYFAPRIDMYAYGVSSDHVQIGDPLNFENYGVVEQRNFDTDEFSLLGSNQTNAFNVPMAYDTETYVVRTDAFHTYAVGNAVLNPDLSVTFDYVLLV
jgi:VCBS repeat-containing protein